MFKEIYCYASVSCCRTNIKRACHDIMAKQCKVIDVITMTDIKMEVFFIQKLQKINGLK